MGGKWKKACARVLLSNAGRKYRSDAVVALKAARVPTGAVKGRLAISVIANPPDRRVRDLDNLLKGSFDALVHAGIVEDDGDFDEIVVRRGPVVRGGELRVEIRELGEFNEQRGFDLPEPQAAANPF